MALTETEYDDKIEIVGEWRFLSVRTKTTIFKDGVEISESFARREYAPCSKVDGVWQDTDISSESQQTQDTAAVWWTTALKDAYKAAVDAGTA